MLFWMFLRSDGIKIADFGAGAKGPHADSMVGAKLLFVKKKNGRFLMEICGMDAHR